MKLKDIKIGDEYAIGAPNASYDRWQMTRGKVTKVGVHGMVRGGWRSHWSARANYVEFEYVKDPGGIRGRGAYEVLLVRYENPKADKAAGYEGWESIERYDRSRLEVERKQVLRCLGSHVLMPWAEFKKLRDEHNANERACEERKEANRDKSNDITRRFADLGIHVSDGYAHSSGIGNFKFNADTTEKILELLEMFRDGYDGNEVRGPLADKIHELLKEAD